MRTRSQSASSSSATIAARPACVPWPTSTCLETTVTQPSGSMRMNGPNAPKSIFGVPRPRISAGEQPTSSAPPALAAPTSSARRVGEKSLTGAFIPAAPSGGHAGGVLDRRADALIGAAAADVAAHGEIDVGVGRLGGLGQERRGAHQLPGLAVAALRHVQLHPRRLQRVIAAEAFDRGDLHGGADRADR